MPTFVPASDVKILMPDDIKSSVGHFVTLYPSMEVVFVVQGVENNYILALEDDGALEMRELSANVQFAIPIEQWTIELDIEAPKQPLSTGYSAGELVLDSGKAILVARLPASAGSREYFDLDGKRRALGRSLTGWSSWQLTVPNGEKRKTVFARSMPVRT